MRRGSSIVCLVMLLCASAACTGNMEEGDDPIATRVAATIGTLSILNPMAAEPVTGEVGVLYFAIRNDGAQPDTLVRAASDISRDVTLHDQIRSGGAGTEMVRVERLEIPAGEVVSLRPGSFHVMLRDLVRHYREGDSITVTVAFSRGGEGTFRAPVISYVDVADRIQHPH